MRPARRCSACGSGHQPLAGHRAAQASLDQTGTAYDAVFYVLAALLFLRSYSRANTPLLRQQLKWLTRGTLLAVLPFTLFYAIPFLFDLTSAQPAHQSGRPVASSFCRSPSVGPSSATG